MLDSSEPKADFKEFILSEVRYASLARLFPDRAETLYAQAGADAAARRAIYRRLAEK